MSAVDLSEKPAIGALGIVMRAALTILVVSTLMYLLSCPVLAITMQLETLLVTVFFVTLSWLVVVSAIIIPLWLFMFIDWTKRMKSDPDIAEPYTVWMVIGWPFGYYFKVYERSNSGS